MELDEILKSFYDNYYIGSHTDGCGGTYITTKEALNQTHSDILKWIKERLPKEISEPQQIGGWADYKLLKMQGWNAYRQETLKNLGIKDL